MKTVADVLKEHRERMDQPRIKDIVTILDDAPKMPPETYSNVRNLTVKGAVIEFDYQYYGQWVHVRLIGRIIKQVDYIEPEKKPDMDYEEDL